MRYFCYFSILRQLSLISATSAVKVFKWPSFSRTRLFVQLWLLGPANSRARIPCGVTVASRWFAWSDRALCSPWLKTRSRLLPWTV
ncbi:hypothetical protein BC567DRAFT_217205 [Phyllosticta citribraziliensis]